MSDLRRKPHTRLLFVICALVLTVGASVMALRGVSAETLGKFGITEQSRAGKLIEKIAPRTFAPKRLSPKTVAPSGATILAEPAAPFATLTVTSGADTGAGTLRNQIAAAASGDTIVFSGVTTVTLTSAELLINKNLTIDGGANGVTITRSGATLFRIFTINSGNTVSFNKLTISNGNRSGQAGGIQNNGTLTMTDCTVSGNTSGQGGGIQNDSVLTMTGCTISGNTATDSDGGGMAAFGTNTTLTNCTFSGNNAIANGGGLSISSGVLVMTNCTVANNTASLSGGEGGALSIANPSLNATLKNTVMIGNSLTVGTTHNVYTQSNFQAGSSNNLLGVGNAGGLTNGVNSNQIGVAAANAPLAALGNYGGATQTHALLPGNPAIDAGTATGAPTADQRGIARVGTTDIGAYESRGFTMALSSGNNQSATVNTAFALPLSLTVTSSNSEPVNGGKVSFTPPGSGASATIAGNPATIASGAATSGTVTANAIIGGPYNLAASATGATSVNFSLTNTNSAPTFTPAVAISRQQGNSAGAAVTVGTVADAQTAAGSLTVTQIAGGTATGITVTGITNTSGTITAVVTASCTATPGTVRFQVSDGSATSTGDLTVNVTANVAPTLTYGGASVLVGGSTSNSATTATDNGSITGYAIQSQGTYTGTISVNASGVVSISNAAPAGTHTITVRATDNCGATTDATFTLTVGCVTSLTVNNTGDGADATPGNGVCETAAGNGVCTLRAAIQEANALTTCSSFTITITATGTITLGSALPALNHPNLTLTGPGTSSLTVSGANLYSPFTVNVGKTVAMSGLTVANGRSSAAGGGISNGGTLTLTGCVVTGCASVNEGGGIANGANASLTVIDSTISNNTVSTFQGGGIGSYGAVTISGSTFVGNSTNGGLGGGIAILNGGGFNGSLTVTNSTFSGNSAAVGGGGLSFDTTLSSTITNCTITLNQQINSGSNGGGINVFAGNVTLKNTIVIDNVGNVAIGGIPSDIIGTVRTQSSFNLIGTGGSGGLTNGVNGNQIGVSAAIALLGTLGNYGGATNIIPLLPGSAAINGGTPTGAPTADQRGIARVGATDIGAFESRGFTLAIAGGNNQSTITNSAFALPLSVSVTSANSEPVNGGRVSFTPPGSGASCALATNPATITSGAATSAATANAIIGGPYTVSAAAAGATSVNFSLTNTNSAPTITAGAALSRQQGTSGSVSTIATVSDGETPVGSLVVTATTVPTGITVTGITNTAGTITATVAASCAATLGNNTVVLTVTDGNSGTATANLTVTVTANSAPTLSYAAASVNAGSATTNSPTTATDNGSISSYAVQSQGTYTGTISVNASGVVSISNAVPPGVHTITIRATDNCGATTDAMFSLTVTNTNPTITAQAGVTRQQGAGSSNSQIATVGDAESGANGVTVKVNNASSATVNGVTVSNISNSGGTVTADIVATCGASNASFTLTATDGHAATATATLNVSVTGITLSTLVNGLTFVPYSQTLTATGGTGSYTFSLVAGTLPPGLTLSGNVLSGTPTTAGASTFTLRASDTSNSCFGERAYTINIGSTGLMYYPLARPVRLLDTRPGASANACYQPNAPITGGTTRTQPARVTCEGLTIPANATTITGHITTVQSGGGSLTLYPSDAPQPNVTNSNYLANEILNNAFTVGLGVNDGAFKLFVGTNTDVVIDVTGYYAPPGAGGLYFHPLPKPIRLLETRTGLPGCQTPGAQLQTGTTRTQTGVLTCDGVTIPTDALALVGNATTTNSAGNGYLTLYPANATQPFASSSNFAAGVNRNAPFTVGLSPSGEFNIYTARTTDLVIDVMGYYSAQVSDTNGQGLLFNSLGAPLRLLDTRAGQSACYTPGAAMTGQTVYTQDTQIPCTNLTSVARGLVGNVSALNATANGFVTFWPSNATQPTVATSNYQTGRVFNRHFTVGLGPDVAFKRYVLSTTDLIIDISGFFAP